MIRLPDDKTLARFAAKVSENEVTGCWEWTGYRAHGYGRFRYEGRAAKAHRVAYLWFVGPLSKALELDHLCRNPGCVNPAHLEQVTHRENMLRGKGLASLHASRTHCPAGHPYDAENTYIAPLSGGRRCIRCARENYQRWYAENRRQKAAA